ncbi:four helix bundle protein [Cellulophaga baltica]|uniref:Four helix bundle protein n=1 Tax=Cellulophaga baltica TaxID=76594 RepID=A0A1G7G5Y4_9FLAO|nr:four helix bundle protein [Cellulophaga baltica]MCR1024025.1 four helix bundle protein [Cellulophaga baltica]SDE83541.1 four helix bundle protein [Cellulophaga baltica]
MDLTEEIYKLMSFMPDDEKYGLTSQIKRCSVSIASNIAEGAGRNSKKEFRNFLSIANGSTTELETQLLLVMRLNLITEEKLVLPLKLTDEKKMNYSLQRSLES